MEVDNDTLEKIVDELIKNRAEIKYIAKTLDEINAILQKHLRDKWTRS